MPDIKITFQALRDKTQQLRDKNKQLDQILTDTKNAINSLEADWSSDTSITIRDKITGMQPTFDTYREVIESYAKFLDSAIAQYESTEATLNTNAASQFI
ncbi:MAG TPA: pore-forming ESAT-6 family protein [Candidatus Intestinimonas pullistercoris]|uniref:Pore-forming ESAT-6 family protein n=1 Tax=Candidatus Intestinimonas pullistercoris TaxID=2838623 RepID=A0A9D2NXG8_9FIRM|nr:pore-forming ESAT-6 family protein [uncultured Intestinimonas sp.]HJC40240.1 pore-forming ESAT-6 family protein [Candidatus Intestinimonas pullistercoris]